MGGDGGDCYAWRKRSPGPHVGIGRIDAPNAGLTRLRSLVHHVAAVAAPGPAAGNDNAVAHDRPARRGAQPREDAWVFPSRTTFQPVRVELFRPVVVGIEIHDPKIGADPPPR